MNMVILLFGFIWQKAREVFSPPPAAMFKRKWPFGLVLTFIFICDVFLPVSGRAQSISSGSSSPELGRFYFTGSHRPYQYSYFREFLTGPGIGDGVKAGPVRLHPFLGVAESYTDNVLSRNTNRRSDFVTTIAPGLQAYLPFGGGRHSVLLDYRAGQFLYKNTSQNNALAQDVQGRLNLTFPGGLKIDLQGGHIEGFDPRGSTFDTQQTDITKWNANTILSNVEFSGPKAGIRLYSSYVDLHYKNNGQAAPRDSTLVTSNLTVFATVTPSTRALLGVLLLKYNYDTNKQLDSFGYGVFTGFTLAPSQKLSGELNIGYQILNYDRAPQAQPPGSGLSSGQNQTTSLYMRGNLQWNPTSRFSLQAIPFSSISQSAVQGTSSFRQTGVSISARQKLTDRLSLRAFSSYANDKFNTNRVDNRYVFRIGPEYRTVKWLGFRLEYIFSKRSSNISDFDFYSNTVMLSIQGIL
ncbi:MAG: outer membrane beta-barrel protein [Nitrospirota bacterium]